MSVDLNPYEIGVTICDKTIDGIVDKISDDNIVFRCTYNLARLGEKVEGSNPKSFRWQ
jgi:hypothetical protein